MTVYVLYFDHNGSASYPQDVTASLEEAERWKASGADHAYSAFEIKEAQ